MSTTGRRGSCDLTNSVATTGQREEVHWFALRRTFGSGEPIAKLPFTSLKLESGVCEKITCLLFPFYVAN